MNETPQPDNAPVDAALASLEPGFLVGNGRFTLVRLIGRGGMGVVWLARDESLREDVALKFLPPEIRFDAVALDDLRRETARARKLTHPNIIRIHDLYKDEREAFISMEYIDGPNLSDLRLEQSERVFTWQYLEPLVKQLCEALDYAHGEKVIHRDLKPANMMLDSRGRLKLSDFGIAAQVSDSVTRVSMIRHSQSGTSTYMSPQQMDGKLPQVSDDIHALGATLYELLTSRPPFFTGDIAYQVRNLPPQPMAERLAELGLENPVPSPVAALIMACLGKSPEQRPQSARAVADWIGLPPTTSAPSLEKIIATPPAPKPAEQRKTSVAPAVPKPTALPKPPPAEPDTADHEEFTEPWETPATVAEHEPARAKTSVLVATLTVLVVASLGTGTAVWWFLRSPAGSKPEIAVTKHGDASATTPAIEPTNAAPAPIPAKLAATAARAPTAATRAPAVPGFVNLFNGRDLTGWTGDSKVWSVVDGSIRGRLTQATSFSKPSVLIWQGGMVEDFELRASFRLPQAGKAGVFYRAKELPGFGAGGYQYEIGRGNLGSLAELGNDRPSRDLKRFLSGNMSASTWHELTITVAGRHITHALDGVVVVEVDDQGENPPAAGLIALKVTSGPTTVEFKNIRIRRNSPAKPDESGVPTRATLTPPSPATATVMGAPKTPPAGRLAGFAMPAPLPGNMESIFNGWDLTGWSGETAAWTATNGTIVGRYETSSPTTHRATGLIYRGADLADFDLEFEFRHVEGAPELRFRVREESFYFPPGYACSLRGSVGNIDQRRRDGVSGGLTYPGTIARGKDTVDAWRQLMDDGGWHKVNLSVRGNHFYSMVDGYAAADVLDQKNGFPRGMIALALHPGAAAEFRNIRLRR